MPDDPKQNKNEKKSTDVKVPPRNWLVWILILFTVPLVVFFKKNTDAKFTSIPRQKFIELLTETNADVTGTIHYPPPQSSMLCEITGHTSSTNLGATLQNSGNFRVKTRLDDLLEKTLLAKGFETAEPNTIFMSIFVTVL